MGGTHQSKTTGGRVHEIHDHFHSALLVAPDLADALTVTAAGAWTLGAAVECINGGSATSVTDPFDIHGLYIVGSSANTQYQMNIYCDGVLVSQEVFEKTATVDPEFSLRAQSPICDAGAVITVKLASSAGAGETVRFKLKYHTYT